MVVVLMTDDEGDFVVPEVVMSKNDFIYIVA